MSKHRSKAGFPCLNIQLVILFSVVFKKRNFIVIRSKTYFIFFNYTIPLRQIQGFISSSTAISESSFAISMLNFAEERSISGSMR